MYSKTKHRNVKDNYNHFLKINVQFKQYWTFQNRCLNEFCKLKLKNFSLNSNLMDISKSKCKGNLNIGLWNDHYNSKCNKSKSSIFGVCFKIAFGKFGKIGTLGNFCKCAWGNPRGGYGGDRAAPLDVE